MKEVEGHLRNSAEQHKLAFSGKEGHAGPRANVEDVLSWLGNVLNGDGKSISSTPHPRNIALKKGPSPLKKLWWKFSSTYPKYGETFSSFSLALAYVNHQSQKKKGRAGGDSFDKWMYLLPRFRAQMQIAIAQARMCPGGFIGFARRLSFTFGQGVLDCDVLEEVMGSKEGRKVAIKFMRERKKWLRCLNKRA